MRYSAIASLAVAFFAGFAVPIAGHDANCEVSDLDEFEYMVSCKKTVCLRFFLFMRESTRTVRVAVFFFPADTAPTHLAPANNRDSRRGLFL